jgi:DNA-binding MarR family transcriptional regulator
MHPLSFLQKRAHLCAVARGREMFAHIEDMTPARFDLLYLMFRGTRELAKITIALGLARQTVWKMVERLVELGLIEKDYASYPKRRIVLFFTDEGRMRVRQAINAAFSERWPLPNAAPANGEVPRYWRRPELADDPAIRAAGCRERDHVTRNRCRSGVRGDGTRWTLPSCPHADLAAMRNGRPPNARGGSALTDRERARLAYYAARWSKPRAGARCRRHPRFVHDEAELRCDDQMPTGGVRQPQRYSQHDAPPPDLSAAQYEGPCGRSGVQHHVPCASIQGAGGNASARLEARTGASPNAAATPERHGREVARIFSRFAWQRTRGGRRGKKDRYLLYLDDLISLTQDIAGALGNRTLPLYPLRITEELDH